MGAYVRTFLICHLILSLWLLPFAGAQAGHAMGGEQQHHGSASMQQTGATQHSADATAPERQSGHDACNDSPTAHSPEHPPTTVPDSETSAHADCCEVNECTSECANGCGHCVAQGHGCSIPTLNTLTQPVQLHGESLSFLAQPYSHIGLQPTPPPNIA